MQVFFCLQSQLVENSGVEVRHSCFLLLGNTTAKVINTSRNKYCNILAWAQHGTNLSLQLFGLELACVSAQRS